MINDYKNKILGFYERNRRMPGYNEIMELTGFKSKNAVYKLINKLVETGAIIKDAAGHILPARDSDEIPLLGLVEAGFPTMIDDNMTDTININTYLIDNREDSYILEVKGDSMIDEGIREGDLVVAVKKGSPQMGDIVIAQVDGGWTMKYFMMKNGKAYLAPANKKYKPIFPEFDLQIVAIVKGVVRKY